MRPDEHLVLPAWLDVEANQEVARLLADEQIADRLEALAESDDRDLGDVLAGLQQSLIRRGLPRLEVAFRVEVIRRTRQALAVQAEIRALPSVTGKHAA